MRKENKVHKRKNDIIYSVLIRYAQLIETRLTDGDLFPLRTYLIESIRNLKRKVICVLGQVFPKYQSVFSDIFGKTSKEILLQFPSPIGLETVSSETLTELLAKLSKQKVGTAKAE